jgi:hypothetical protein
MAAAQAAAQLLALDVLSLLVNLRPPWRLCRHTEVVGRRL